MHAQPQAVCGCVQAHIDIYVLMSLYQLVYIIVIYDI